MPTRYRVTTPDGDPLYDLPEYLGGGRPPTFSSRKKAQEYVDSISHGRWVYGVQAYRFGARRRRRTRFEG